MNNLVLVVFWILGLATLAYHRASMITAVTCISIGVIVTFLLGGIGWFLLLLSITTVGATFYFLFDSKLRKKYLIKPIFRKLRANIPNISKTEEEALAAGTVWWDGELFSGNPHWQKLLDTPTNILSKEERDFIDGPVEELCSMINNWKINFENHDITTEIWDYIKNNTFFGLIIPKKYGGLEFSNLAHSEILSKIAGKSITVASTVSVPNSLGPAELILHYGTEQQKEHYLPRLANGTEIPCFALTGPEAGSDATSIPDVGIVCKQEFQGKITLGILINWNKRYITLAPIATVLGLAFKLKDPENLLGKGDDIGITCALIPTNISGITIGERHIPLTAKFMNGPTLGKDVFIPIEWVIGGEKMVGKGWKMLVESLSCGRAISLPSITAGNARSALAASSSYARIRQQFNKPIGYFEGIEEPLARIASNVYASDALRVITAACIDNGEKPSVLGAIVKYHVTEMSRKTSIDAMDIHAGKGIIQGPKNYIAEGYINAPIGITVEGANILTRSMIIFGQGSIRCHPYIMQELHALQTDNEMEALDKFDAVFQQHTGYILANIAKSFFGYFTAGRIIFSPVKHSASKYYQWCTWASSAFALLSDIHLVIYGGKLKFKETASARLGDLLSMLYLCSAVLKRYEDDGHPDADQCILEYTIRQNLFNFWEAMNDLINNIPNAFVKYSAKIFIMPFGNPIRKPSDAITKKVAKLMMYPNNTRERLLSNTYLSANELNPIGQLEIALKQVLAAESIENRLNRAKKDQSLLSESTEEIITEALQKDIITDAEAMILRKAHQARLEVIAVDSFSQDTFKMQSTTIA